MGDSEVVILIATICVDGLIISANIVEISLLLKKWGKFEPIEHLLFSLCISDLLCGISGFIQDSFQLKYKLEDDINNMISLNSIALDSLFIFFLLLSNFHVICIAIERLVAVMLPRKYSMFDSIRFKTFTLCFIWTFALILAPVISVVPMVIIRKLKDSNVRTQRTYGGIFMTACFLVFIIYMWLFIMLLIRERKLRELLPEENRQRLRDRRNTYVCLMLGFSFFVFTFPYALGLLDFSLYFPLSNLLLMLNHVFNPLVYYMKTYFDQRRRSTSIASTLITREYSLTATSASSANNR